MADLGKNAAPGVEERPVIDYQPPPTARPVTGGERLAVSLGYLLLGGGIGLTLVAVERAAAGKEHSLLPIAIITLLAGAGVTGCCYIYNAVRRM